MTITRKTMPSTKPVSIEDVATAAAVSTATVSRVLNNPSLVAPATAARVQQAIVDLDYRPNLFAKGLSTKKSHVLGIALPDIFGEFYSELLRGADGEARRAGYHLLVSSEARFRDTQNGENDFGFGLIDGMAVMITEPNSTLLPAAQKANVPIVVLDAEPQEGLVDTVVVDNAVGTREATLHLLASVDPDKCFFVGGPRENFDTVERARAFRETIASRGHAISNNQFAYGAYTTEWGHRWTVEHLKSLKGAGVLAGNDEIAYGIMMAAIEASISIPQDLKLIGFDDTRLASLVRPRLSTVRMPAAEIGAAAIRALVARLRDPSSSPTHLRLPSQLIIRESSALNGHANSR